MVASLDIGTSSIKAALAEITPGRDINILGISQVAFSGLKKGNIVDIEGTARAIDRCLNELERLTGVQIYNALVGFSGVSINTVNNHAVVSVGNPSYEITRDDKERVLQSACNVSLPPDKTILQMIERQYIVDGYDGVKDPVGMVGSRLESEVSIITAAGAAIQNMQRSTTRINLQVDYLIYNPLLVSESVLLPAEKEMGVVLIDFGAGITEVTLFEGGSMLHSSVLPVGDEYITRDLAIVLKTSIEEAARIKQQYGIASPELLGQDSQDSMVAIKNVQGKEIKQVSQQVIADIINARVVEIIAMILAEMKRYIPLEGIPGGIVLAGGGVELPGLINVMEEYLNTSVRMGLPENLRGLPTEFNRPQNAAVLGGIIYAAQNTRTVYYEEKGFTGIFHKMNYWLRDLFS
ncbi:MAG: cell division protein FtsA [Syntrophomonadaceae bacterium]|nr:cell division protein FtsA [Syntrophomonadaceae bacterium]MDD3271966.1 cell division protein FtsA [Syntrophomonadaceae bacterium]MDD4562916.1 cell division protein FtsA [Syntrophomonadaceae bacterium]